MTFRVKKDGQLVCEKYVFQPVEVEWGKMLALECAMRGGYLCEEDLPNCTVEVIKSDAEKLIDLEARLAALESKEV